jgi:NAD kinase
MDKIDETLIIKHKLTPSERTRIWKQNNKQKVKEQQIRYNIKHKDDIKITKKNYKIKLDELKSEIDNLIKIKNSLINI